MSLYELRGVSKRYVSGRRTVQALHESDLTIAQGDRLGVVGGSGSGKTTLARMLVALARPTTGEIWFEGRRTDQLVEKQLGDVRSKVQFVFQDPRSSLDPRMKVAQIVTEPLRSPLLKGRQDVPADHDARLYEVLAAVGLERGAADRYPHEFSGGQRQRIAIARALAARPEVLIADEPVSALDVSVRSQVINLLNDLVAELSLTLVVVSHDLAVIRELCDQIVVLSAGQIVERGPATQLLTKPQHPYTKALLSAVPKIEL